MKNEKIVRFNSISIMLFSKLMSFVVVIS